jgi:hypothetical protein
MLIGIVAAPDRRGGRPRAAGVVPSRAEIEAYMSAQISRILLLLLLVITGTTRADDPADRWSTFRFLLGEWVGEGAGDPGPGSGQFAFALDLAGHVLVRRNRSDIPAANGRPAVSHEDLLIVYAGAGGLRDRAIYFDNEGHTIAYTVTATEPGKSLTFLSDAEPGTPRFRLTYVQTAQDALEIKFEIAPPGKPEEFRVYLVGKARRKPK